MNCFEVFSEAVDFRRVCRNVKVLSVILLFIVLVSWSNKVQTECKFSCLFHQNSCTLNGKCVLTLKTLSIVFVSFFHSYRERSSHLDI